MLEVVRLLENRDYLGALQKLNQPEIDANNLVVKQLIHFNRGHALLNLGRNEDAQEEFIKYGQLTPIVGNMLELVLSGISDGNKKKDE